MKKPREKKPSTSAVFAIPVPLGIVGAGVAGTTWRAKKRAKKDETNPLLSPPLLPPEPPPLLPQKLLQSVSSPVGSSPAAR
jgi:hypothetical protein